ncbi:diguanylate cyclase domain-containing protein [Cellulomonas sp. ICMP 17802]|uniref:diguanylate cyclase domain-containing protein n=1 Tax=Cellulomonas sp. ICMP 17802 TaxID=3239199 RepID=UPI00351BE343
MADVQTLLRDLRSGAVPPTSPVATLAVPMRVIDAEMPVHEVEPLFLDPALLRIGVIDHADRSRIGLLTRSRFNAGMAGRLGYGRAVLTRRPARAVADWRPLVVDPASSVVEAALLAMARPPESRFEDVVVRADVWSATGTAELVHALAAALADQGMRDRTTGLVNRHTLEHTLDSWAREIRDSRRRLAVTLVDVAAFGLLNAIHGLPHGDRVLGTMAQALTGAFPRGCVLGRLGDDEILVAAVLPAVPDERAREVAEDLRRTALRALRPSPPGFADGEWPRVRAVAAVSLQGWADVPLLLQDLQRSMRNEKAVTAPSGPSRDV